MSADALIDDLEGRGRPAVLDGGRLRFKAPGGVMTDAVRAPGSPNGATSIIAALKERRRTLDRRSSADPTAPPRAVPQNRPAAGLLVGEEGLY